jgi:hypothetical protein
LGEEAAEPFLLSRERLAALLSASLLTLRLPKLPEEDEEPSVEPEWLLELERGPECLLELERFLFPLREPEWLVELERFSFLLKPCLKAFSSGLLPF